MAVLLIPYCQVMKQLDSLSVLRVEAQPTPRRPRGLFSRML
jgi:hypothetical protein